MKRRLYSNMRRMTALFSVAILCVTLSALTLRLTVLGDLAGGLPGGASIERVESDLLDYTIARRVTFRTATARGDMRIENLSDTFYMSVSIILPDTEQEVFYSGLIEPGQSLPERALHVQLPTGTHESVARITAYDPNTLQPRGSHDREITLYIG
ncbi:MAG: hypothetical protein FWE32_00785 [Oscillospiraceae bacterium]|nr:hypothetical protein [Oscillospiraceae bacterium]